MMQIMKRNGVSLPWPVGLVDLALADGWTLPPEEDDLPDEVHVVTHACPEGLVEIMLPEGTKETATCLKTPEWLGAERWFTKTKLHAYWFDGEHWMIQTSPDELKKRRLQHLVA